VKLALRRSLDGRTVLVLQAAAVAALLAVWTVLTWGEPERRLLSPLTLPSPFEVLGQVRSLWFDAALTRSVAWSLERILLGFGLAALVGVPVGIAAGCFRAVEAALSPSTIFLRNVPIAALIPLTLVWFGLGETQKVFFIFIACVGFVIFDTTRALLDVDERYVETAYTLGARRGHVIRKVLVPLALPDIMNSLRLLFGVAFGYIVLAELIDARFGLGYIIQVAQRRGPREHIYLVLVIITVLAFGTDRLLWLAQRKLFPYRFAKG
jgi:NitT/TauT family transport system permease protein